MRPPATVLRTALSRRRAQAVRGPKDTDVRPSETDHRSADLRVARAADAEDALQAARRRAEGRRGRGAGGGARRLRAPRRPADRRGRRRLPDRHAYRAARVGPQAVPRADDAEAVGAGARDAGGDRLQAADHRARDRRDPRRQQQRRRALDADRAPADQDRRPQAGRRPAVHVRDDARVPRAVRPERPQRSAEGRGDVRRARLRAAGGARRADGDRDAAAVRRGAGRSRHSRRSPAPVDESGPGRSRQIAPEEEEVH